MNEDDARPTTSIYVRRFWPTDGAAVLNMHARCSRESQYSRWFAPSTAFPASYLRSLMAGEADHIAVVAVPGSQPGHVIGLASAAKGSDECWELGFLVEDHYQAQGVGRHMLDALIGLVDPAQPLCAYALKENRWALDKLARYGSLQIYHDGGVCHVRIARARKGLISRVRPYGDEERRLA